MVLIFNKTKLGGHFSMPEDVLKIRTPDENILEKVRATNDPVKCLALRAAIPLSKELSSHCAS